MGCVREQPESQVLFDFQGWTQATGARDEELGAFFWRDRKNSAGGRAGLVQMLSRLRTFTLRLWGLFTRRRFDRELDQEFQAHLDMLTERLVRQGLPEEEAQYAARRQFGGITQMKEELREHHSLAFLDSMFGDIRYAFRQLRKAPAFAAATILTLALGIGATTAIFSLLDAVILKSLPVKNPQEL